MTTKPVIVSFTLHELLAKAHAEAEAGEAAFAAMTPEEQAAYIAERKKEDEEIEELLTQLRSPGFIEMSIPRRSKKS